MEDENEDFREIAHCGGQLILSFSSDNDGKYSYTLAYSLQSMGPAGIFGVYALPQGIPCGDIQLRGIGQSWNAPPFPDCIAVFIASDTHGLFGHMCPGCHNYWRSSGAPSRWHMTCPYCGERGHTWQFRTAAQKDYIVHFANELSNAFDEAARVEKKKHDVVIDMDKAADEATIPKPDFYYAGRSQQTKFVCSGCDGLNDIRGKFGYCCICGTRNNLAMLSSEMSSLRERLNGAQAVSSDILQSSVSKFDSCCRNYVVELINHVPLTKNRGSRLSKMLFHNFDRPFEEIKNVFDIDLLSGINSSDKKFLNMMFCRRHAFEHDGGHITENYILNSGDSALEVGSLIREKRENVHRLIGLLNRITSNLHKGFHELIPPVEEPLSIQK